MAIALIVVGLFVGVCSGLLGIGGGTLIVPILRMDFGLSAYSATATSLFTIVFTSLSGAGTHLRNRTCIPKLGVVLGVGGAITSALGVALANVSPEWAVMVVAALIIAYSAYNMLNKALKLPKTEKEGASKPQSAPAAPDAPAAQPAPAAEAIPAPEDFSVTKKVLVVGFCIGLIAGLASGYVGVGGGFIMVPLMTTWLSVPMKKASGTSLIAIIILAIPGVIEHIVLGNVDYLAGVLIVAGSIPSAVLGAKLIKKVPERSLRFLFAAFLGVAAVALVLNEAGILG